MGKRVNYEIVGGGGHVGAVLYSNSSHSKFDPEALFATFAAYGSSISGLVQGLLSITYPSTDGNHLAGEPVFTIDLDPGDREYVLRAVFGPTIQGKPVDQFGVSFERAYDDGRVIQLGAGSDVDVHREEEPAPGL